MPRELSSILSVNPESYGLYDSNMGELAGLPNERTRYKLEVEFILDGVSGAYHQPEDLINDITKHSYVTSVSFNADKQGVSSSTKYNGITVDIFPMKLSGDRTEYWVRITNGGVTYDTNVHSQEYYNRALYERDMLRHVLCGEPKPWIMLDQYADPETTT